MAWPMALGLASMESRAAGSVAARRRYNLRNARCQNNPIDHAASPPRVRPSAGILGVCPDDSDTLRHERVSVVSVGTPVGDKARDTHAIKKKPRCSPEGWYQMAHVPYSKVLKRYSRTQHCVAPASPPTHGTRCSFRPPSRRASRFL